MGDSRSLLVSVVLFVVLSGNEFFVRASSEITTEPSTLDEQKLLLDCQNPNYRTYIKCLKYSNHKGSKVKRHHFPHSEEKSEIDHHCMESCLKNCETTTSFDCNQKCAHCVRRTKHRHQIITEYETECSDGSCRESSDSDKLSTTNITTTIGINNIIKTGDNTGHDRNNDTCNCTCCPTCRCPSWCCGGGFTGGGGGIGQLTLVPQLTLGLGLGIGSGIGTGCASPYPWLCPPQQGPWGVDCSGCHNPFLRYKCDVSCYGYYGNPHYPSDRQPCQSPHCVGGS
ncbi:hypothetical protein KPH14_007902 [Odynerus spinipes]|uniref:Uncharacterized protein n=1 Tax=Odynerus spinipes TaxID=1348599 RepID=A0AAD9S1I2_9HYME|nr:hypothetical protein KPH14_007902 [Odynerus spinipes]